MTPGSRGESPATARTYARTQISSLAAKGYCSLLKSRQIKKLILDALTASKAPAYAYLGYARGTHYLSYQKQAGSHPKHHLVAIVIDEKAKIVSLRRGVSYFGEIAQIAVAPSFSHWILKESQQAEFGSKQAAKRALNRLLSSLGDGGGGFTTAHRVLADDRRVAEAFVLFENSRQQLADEGSPARQEFKQRVTPDLYEQVLRLCVLVENWTDDDALDAYLTALGQIGSYQGRAGFSLNREQAIRKLSDYQLGDPVLFPLFLAVGLSLAKATRIDIEIDSDETWVRFKGSELDESFLEEIPSLLLTSAAEAHGLALQAVGRALLQGAGGNAQTLRLETASGPVDLRGFPKSVTPVGWGDQPGSGTFYRRQRFGLAVAKRFWSSRAQPHSEVPELRRALALLPLPWSLNGHSYDGNLENPPATLSVVWRYPGLAPIHLISTDGTILERESPVPATVLFRFHPALRPQAVAVLNGMIVGLPDSARLEPRSDVTLWLSPMATDLSGRHLVESQLLSEILESLEALELKSWAELSFLFASLPEEIQLAWTGPLLEASRDPKIAALLERVPFLPRVGQTPLSPHQWINTKRRLFSAQSFTHPLLSGDPVLAVRPEWLKELKRLVPNPVDATSELEQTQAYHSKREAWMAQPEAPWCPPLEAIPDVIAEMTDEQGWLFISETRTPERLLVRLGRPLPIELPWDWAPPYVGFVLKAEGLAMDWDWKKAVPANELARLRSLVASSIANLADRFTPTLLEDERRPQQLLYLLAFMKLQDMNIRRWESLRFLASGQDDLLANLQERPDALEPILKELS